MQHTIQPLRVSEKSFLVKSVVGEGCLYSNYFFFKHLGVYNVLILETYIDARAEVHQKNTRSISNVLPRDLAQWSPNLKKGFFLFPCSKRARAARHRRARLVPALVPPPFFSVGPMKVDPRKAILKILVVRHSGNSGHPAVQSRLSSANPMRTKTLHPDSTWKVRISLLFLGFTSSSLI
jgi:hypothetical protein